MQAVDLMDSRKFMAILGELRDEMVNNGLESEGLPDKLQAVLDAAGPQTLKTQVVTYGQEKPVIKESQYIAERLIKSARSSDRAIITNVEADTAKPKRARRTKAQMQLERLPTKPEFTAQPMSLKERREMAKRADSLAQSTPPAEAVLADFIKTTLKPAYLAGARKFNIPNQYKQRVLTVNHEVWENVLRGQGIGFSELDWSFPTTPIEMSGIPEDSWPLAIK